MLVMMVMGIARDVVVEYEYVVLLRILSIEMSFERESGFWTHLKDPLRFFKIQLDYLEAQL